VSGCGLTLVVQKSPFKDFLLRNWFNKFIISKEIPSVPSWRFFPERLKKSLKMLEF
jgi:hypothetical protein